MGRLAIILYYYRAVSFIFFARTSEKQTRQFNRIPFKEDVRLQRGVNVFKQNYCNISKDGQRLGTTRFKMWYSLYLCASKWTKKPQTVNVTCKFRLDFYIFLSVFASFGHFWDWGRSCCNKIPSVQIYRFHQFFLVLPEFHETAWKTKRCRWWRGYAP